MEGKKSMGFMCWCMACGKEFEKNRGYKFRICPECMKAKLKTKRGNTPPSAAVSSTDESISGGKENDKKRD